MTNYDRNEVKRMLRRIRCSFPFWHEMSAEQKVADRILAHATVYVLNNDFATTKQLKRLMEAAW